MSVRLKLCIPYSTKLPFYLTFHSPASPFPLRLPIRRSTPLTLQSHFDPSSPSPSQPSIPSQYIASVGSSPPSSLRLSLTSRHLLFLNFIACAVFSLSLYVFCLPCIFISVVITLQAAISATWLFFSAIPTLLAFKRAAESLEKMMDTTREELPDTMAAIRLSGMEISDLTMELSDLGQEITQGVRSSTKAVSLAEERLRRFQNMAPPTDGSQSKK